MEVDNILEPQAYTNSYSQVRNTEAERKAISWERALQFVVQYQVVSSEVYVRIDTVVPRHCRTIQES